MGTMNKLRENTGVILWILVISFGVIWTLQDSNVFEATGQQTRNIAVVEGTPIPYEEYQNALQQQREQMRQQAGGEIPPRMEGMIEERTFESLVNDQLMQQEMDRLGITVSNAEVEDMVYGNNPDPFIRQQFSDSTGQVNRQLIMNVARNPETKQSWLQIEDYLRNKRRAQKMNALVGATVRVTEQEVLNTYRQRNLNASADYVALRYASIPNDSIDVTEDDLRTFYENNQDDYERKRTYTLTYATISKEASEADTSAVMGDLEELREEFTNAENDSLFLSDNASQREFNSSYFTADELEAPIADALFPNPEPGTVVGPVVAGDAAHLVKVRDTRPAESTALHARHILIQTNGDGTQAQQQAQEIINQLEDGANFAQLARQYSDDTGSAQRGGDLGWFGRGRMVEAFETAAFNASIGAVVGPVESRFGYHIIEVLDRADEAVQIADLAYSLRPSNATLDEARYTLEDVAYYAEEESNFSAEAERQGLQVQQVDVEEGQASIPGLGRSQTIMSFLESADEGDISDVINMDDRFVVFQVSDIQNEGYRPFEQVRSEIEPRVRLQKKRQIVTRRMEQALAENNFSGLADALGVPQRSNSGITFETDVVEGLGREPAFAGTVFGLDEGETSRVVEGENAAFVVRVTAMNEPPAITEQQRQQIREELLQQRRQRVQNQWIASLREKAEIQDNRAQFQQ